MKILLFDMDGVLLESRGYHLALQETVRRMANRLGFGQATLSPEDIAAFESGGITCEWDEAALCTALLLTTAWQTDPACRLPDSLAGPDALTSVPWPAPDYGCLARSLNTPEFLPLHPLARAERHFLSDGRFKTAQVEILQELIRSARDRFRSLTHRTFQEFVLGSREYTQSHGLPAALDTESYLLKYDRSNLTEAGSARLRDWMSAPGQRAAVITSRPSKPPVGIFSTPEAELGAQLVGLPEIPILGWGGMVWLGEIKKLDPQSFLKPSPVHALAGMRMALGETQEAALAAAVELVETGRIDPSWRRLEGAKVSVYEDTPGGIRSLQLAREQLARSGVHLDPEYIGVAQQAIKVEALQAMGATVYPSLTAALMK